MANEDDDPRSSVLLRGGVSRTVGAKTFGQSGKRRLTPIIPVVPEKRRFPSGNEYVTSSLPPFSRSSHAQGSHFHHEAGNRAARRLHGRSAGIPSAASQVLRELMRKFVERQRHAREYDQYFRLKVVAGRASMRVDRGRSNEEVEATFVARRAAVAQSRKSAGRPRQKTIAPKSSITSPPTARVPPSNWTSCSARPPPSSQIIRSMSKPAACPAPVK